MGSAKGRRQRDGIGLMSTAGGLVVYGDNTGGALTAVDAKNWTAPLAIRDSPNLEIQPDDLCDRRDAVHRRRFRIDGQSLRRCRSVIPECRKPLQTMCWYFVI
jgi:hypothetical protein